MFYNILCSSISTYIPSLLRLPIPSERPVAIGRGRPGESVAMKVHRLLPRATMSRGVDSQIFNIRSFILVTYLKP